MQGRIPIRYKECSSVPAASQIQQEIRRLKKERNAIILAHNYQRPEVQDIADITGDSLELSRAAAEMDGDVIVFCGVNFMAETAAVLSPEKCVLLRQENTGCPMADMITADELVKAKSRHPDAAVVCYVNTTAEVKAESDICCTSANAVQVVNSVAADTVLFVPDRNLGQYAARFTTKTIIPWDGYCHVHDDYTVDDVLKAKRAHPDAVLLVHPECRPEVIDRADLVASTSGMIRHVSAAPQREFIIGTENGILFRWKKSARKRNSIPCQHARSART